MQPMDGCGAAAGRHLTGVIQMRRFLALAAASMIFAFSTPSAFAGDQLSQGELRRLFPGNFHAIVYGILQVKLIAHGNGQLTGLFSGKKDTGRWSVRDGKLCILLTRWMDGKTSCSPVVAANGWYRGNGVRFKKL